MKDVDDPSGRVDKTMDEILKTKNTFPTLSPTALPTLHPHPINLITITNK
jgi:hypothetical protein